MRDVALMLQLARHGEKAGRDHLRACALENRRPDDDVGDAGLVLDREKDRAAGRTRPLTHQDKARHRDAPAIPSLGQRHAGYHPSPFEFRPDEGHGMGLERQRQVPVILDHMFAERHGWKVRFRLDIPVMIAGEKRQVVLVAGPV